MKGKERSEKPPALYLPTGFLRLPENEEVLMGYKEEVIGSAPALSGGFHIVLGFDDVLLEEEGDKTIITKAIWRWRLHETA